MKYRIVKCNTKSITYPHRYIAQYKYLGFWFEIDWHYNEYRCLDYIKEYHKNNYSEPYKEIREVIKELEL